MPKSKTDNAFESDTTRKVFWALHKLHITDLIIRGAIGIYGKANKFNPKEFRIFSVGQSHLDTAWNWRWIPDTAPYKLSHTMGYNLNNLKLFPNRQLRSGYTDGYKFSFPAAAHYEYMEKTWPRSFKKLSQEVQRGRWEIVGGWWVEADCNVPDGESLVRQGLYGQRYFIERFGKKCLIAWLPDTFGFCWTLPQILAKSGMKGFLTSKMTWNTPSRPGTGHPFPFGWFHWQSPDGSKVLAYNFWHGWRGLEKVGRMKEFCRLVKSNSDPIFNYCVDIDHDSRLGPDFISEFLWAYGAGDGGHGPFPIEIMVADAAERTGKMQQVKAGTIFNLIAHKYDDRLPIWNDELYLEVHRGVQTTLHTLKQQNRIAETTLQSLEKLICFCFGFETAQFKEKLDKVWKTVLFNQFHDILPGSSIQEVYEDTNHDFETIITPILDELTYFCSPNRKSLTQTELENDNSIAFFPHHWAQVYPIRIDSSNLKKIYYITKPPGIGIFPLKSQPSQKVVIKEENDAGHKTFIINTNHFSAELSQVDASFHSLILNGDKFNFASSQLNILRLFQDYPNSNDAWNLDWDYRDKLCDPLRVISAKKHEYDSNIVIEFQITIGTISKGILHYVFSNAVPFIECFLDIDWQEDHRLLRVEFDSACITEKYITGIPYGWIERPTVPKTPLEKGRWEVPGQMFFEFPHQNGQKGLALFMFDRYGFHADHQQFGMSLLKAPSYEPPDRKACAWYDPNTLPTRQKIKDLGMHHLRWAIYPHNNNWQSAEVLPKAIAFNYPPILMSSLSPTLTQSQIELRNEICQIDVPNVNLAVIKPPYDSTSHSIILRCIELYGLPTSVTITWNGFNQAQIKETDLLELPLVSFSPLSVKDNNFQFKIGAFEIKTFRVQLP